MPETKTVTETLPRPGWPLVVNSVVIIVACVWLTSLVLAALMVAWQPCYMFGASILLPFPIVVGLVQYAACFRGKARGARTVALPYFLIGSLLLLAAALNAADRGKAAETSEVALLGFFAGGGYLVFCGWINVRFSRTLQRAQPDERSSDASESGQQAQRQPPEPATGRFSLSRRELLAVAMVIVAVAAMTAYHVTETFVQYEENVRPEKAPMDLPAGAADVSYCWGESDSLAYEFTIGEKGFWQWAEELPSSREMQLRKSDVQRIESPIEFPRYVSLSRDLAGPKTATIRRGYYFQFPKAPKVQFAYDSNARRAYYYRTAPFLGE